MAFWENSPTETTPLSASNLSRMEKYTTATSGSNGDFYVTINNSSGLATGDVVKITFPSATLNTANARLSIDGGATYKNIKDKHAFQFKGVNIENQMLELYFDGTNFIPKDFGTVLYDANGVFGSVLSLTDGWSTGSIALGIDVRNYDYLRISTYIWDNNAIDKSAGEIFEYDMSVAGDYIHFSSMAYVNTNPSFRFGRFTFQLTSAGASWIKKWSLPISPDLGAGSMVDVTTSTTLGRVFKIEVK